ncbi:MAG: tRNA (adenosine(37)-N6)-threonylcarbamoyltransferase complex ATPase subunit type 1 TsaE [Myxococcaceae bacterium]|nr:tRNA (adenosine(37)-N6)-threonylcarbamoyltransferase complex ATPase subunit type 1 TsaE [Myxococcaceae bacterium]
MDALAPLSRVVESDSPDETFSLGARLGGALAEGDFVGLDGPLGAGKTAFSRGVAHGAGVALDDVSSPTYSIVQTYPGRVAVHHADLYRLSSEADLFGVGSFELLESPGVMLVEWVSQVPGARPEDALWVRLEVAGPKRRVLRVVATGPRSRSLLERWLPSSGV